MSKSPHDHLMPLMGFALSCILATHLSADQFGDFTFTDNGMSVTITGYPSNSTGDVVIPDSINGKPVTEIGPSAFEFCTELTSIGIPASVVSIEARSFFYCASLTSIVIPPSVVSIGEESFYHCDSLSSIVIPSNVTSIGDLAFAFCSELDTISIDPLNPVFSSIDGMVFSKDQTTLISCPAGKPGAVSIPDGVAHIARLAFYSCAKMTDVAIPDSVASMGDSAFAICQGLTSVSIPTGVAVIEYATFVGCINMASVTIPSSVTVIGDSAFQECRSLTSVTIPTSVTTIGVTAFAVCTNLENITIPTSVTAIGRYAFHLCFDLVSVTIPSSVTTIGDGTFDSCFSLSDIALPEGLASIGREAFSYCESLTSIEIPASVTNIGEGAFERCKSLTAISVAPLNSAYSSLDGILFDKNASTLLRCPGGKTGKITLPSSVSTIGEFAFQDCENLAGVTLSGGVSSIGIGAFDGCDNLKGITIPASVASIGDEAFTGCNNLESACFLGDAPTMGYSVFDDAANNFAVYFFNGATGFTVPTWNGYPSVNIGTFSPVAPWLLENGFAHNENLQADHNGDGVNLLMAYALGLDPNDNLCGSMPQAALSGNEMSLSFFGGREGVNYVVQASNDLNHWTESDVTLSPPDGEGNRRASISVNGPHRFMRLLVSY